MNAGDSSLHASDRLLGEAVAWAEAHSPTQIIVSAGAARDVGRYARARGAAHALIVTDPGIEEAGHLQPVLAGCQAAGLRVHVFDRVGQNPTTAHVREGLQAANDASRSCKLDCIIGIGGGSAMDCAKGINLLLTNGGQVQDYWGINKASRPLLPSILVPTTAGTGSEAQSFALITDETSHAKMACGDRRPPRDGGLRPLLAVLDSDLTATTPVSVRAAVAVDAVSHAIETAGCNARTDDSRHASALAWSLLIKNFEQSLRSPADARARQAMLLAAHVAGIAIEQSMLGAAHACANPLTARYGIVHGIAVGLMLPRVVQFNSAEANPSPYEGLGGVGELMTLLHRWLRLAGVPECLRDAGVREGDLPALARMAAEQWTAKFNPRPVGEVEMLAIYRAAY